MISAFKDIDNAMLDVRTGEDVDDTARAAGAIVTIRGRDLDVDAAVKVLGVLMRELAPHIIDDLAHAMQDELVLDSDDATAAAGDVLPKFIDMLTAKVGAP